MSWNHLEDTKPRARKVHQCLLCENDIPIGERHVRRTAVNEDGLSSFRMHEACEAKTKGWDEWDWERHDASEFRLGYLDESSDLT